MQKSDNHLDADMTMIRIQSLESRYDTGTYYPSKCCQCRYFVSLLRILSIVVIYNHAKSLRYVFDFLV
jgi:hypothetical protein